MKSLLAPLLCCAAAALAAALAPLGQRGAQREMERAATAFLECLRPEQREKARLGFEDPARRDWHYVPRERAGIPLGELAAEQRVAAERLLKSALSVQGYRKYEGVLQLEELLFQRSGSSTRDPGNYTLALFGAPGGGPWGWRVEGHHLSLHFTAVPGGEVAVTPHFFGAQPARVGQGLLAGTRVLGPEETLARELVSSLTNEQRRAGIDSSQPPSDVVYGPGREGGIGEPKGIPASQLRPEQRKSLMELVERYVRNVHREWADRELERIRQAGVERIHFLWIGDAVSGPHYYRVQGPGFVIEYDNTQDGANHAHSVWRDLGGDFGADLLRRHREESHGGR